MSERDLIIKNVAKRLEKEFKDHPDKNRIIGFGSGLIARELDNSTYNRHALRLAVLDCFNMNPKLFLGSGKFTSKLALSAGIIFEKGTWILKD